MDMNVNTRNLVSIDEANQDFSHVARMVDERGPVVILENDSPRYLLIGFDEAEQERIASTEDILSISKRLIDRNRKAYEALAN
jgi:antitoxin Phd